MEDDIIIKVHAGHIEEMNNTIAEQAIEIARLTAEVARLTDDIKHVNNFEDEGGSI